jgi:cell division protein FtsZ
VPVIDAATLSGQADPVPANDPLSVALDLDDDRPLRPRVKFEEYATDDDIDVPDFMK